MGVLEFSLGFRNRAARGVGRGLLGRVWVLGTRCFAQPTRKPRPCNGNRCSCPHPGPDEEGALAVSESSELISLEFLLECLLDSAQFLNGSTDV